MNSSSGIGNLERGLGGIKFSSQAHSSLATTEQTKEDGPTKILDARSNLLHAVRNIKYLDKIYV